MQQLISGNILMQVISQIAPQ
ncbi:hypothetical protein BN13_2070002 [Nostocoides jenkinsii Ben 74]|uniref:Uncharacterized protein n=1 Tax=Nostocoides jenkinsii Ben 74 TaxID=1193518 RepID=A0A077MDB4_9MICO|nr:hypothetical protein BN13_2070002 [Tetrasphaera jenkinsii Ben 74]